MKETKALALEEVKTEETVSEVKEAAAEAPASEKMEAETQKESAPEEASEKEEPFEALPEGVKEPEIKDQMNMPAVDKIREKSIKELIENKTVLYGDVVRENKVEGGSTNLYVKVTTGGPLKNMFVTVERNEADANFKSGPLGYLVGHSVPVIILSVKDGVIYASRKSAQKIVRNKIKDKLIAKEPFTAKILNFNKYGAFVSVMGVTGLIKNTDCTIDYSEIREHFNAGDSIEVVCKEFLPNGHIYFKAAEKIHRKEAPVLDFTVGSTVIGNVDSIKPFKGVPFAFVRISVGIHVMSVIPFDMDIAEGSSVAVKVTDILPARAAYEAPRVRGRIERILG